MEQRLFSFGKEDYSKIYAIYFPKLVRFSQTYLHTQEDAENLVQDIFLYLWENREQIPLLGNMNAYLFTVVKNRCIDFSADRQKMMKKIDLCLNWKKRNCNLNYILCRNLMKTISL